MLNVPPSVGDFVERYGRPTAPARMYTALGLSECRPRSLVRAILDEVVGRPPRFIDDGGHVLLPGWSR